MFDGFPWHTNKVWSPLHSGLFDWVPTKHYLFFSTTPLHTSSTPIKISQHSSHTPTPCTLFVLFTGIQMLSLLLRRARVPPPPPSLPQPTVTPVLFRDLGALTPCHHTGIYVNFVLQIYTYVYIRRLMMLSIWFFFTVLTRFLNLSTIDIWGWITLLRWDVVCIVGCLAAFLASTH